MAFVVSDSVESESLRAFFPFIGVCFRPPPLYLCPNGRAASRSQPVRAVDRIWCRIMGILGNITFFRAYMEQGAKGWSGLATRL